ncbi:hypothetical protein L208DRAFT_1379922 [Tricholoma matsutake]|nr:hypothetical protein L208DRAFT_1379922 [Tricholoma matsutake 945]
MFFLLKLAGKGLALATSSSGKTMAMGTVTPASASVTGMSTEDEDANNALWGALVEVHFTLKHFHIKRENYKSFLVIPQQVLVLRCTDKKPVPHDVRAGPVSLAPELSGSIKINKDIPLLRAQVTATPKELEG